MALIDCPYYKESSSSIPAGVSHHNCWGMSGWDDFPCRCNVPGCSKPICNPKTNGWVGGVFVAKVQDRRLKKALKDYSFLESLKPKNIVKRLDILENLIGKLKK